MHTGPAKLVVLIDEADVACLAKARKTIAWQDRWGKWVAAVVLLTAAGQLGISVLILYVTIRVQLAIPGPIQGFLAGIGFGIVIGAVAGYFLVQGLATFREAICFFKGGFPEYRLLLKLHDSLATVLLDTPEAGRSPSNISADEVRRR